MSFSRRKLILFFGALLIISASILVFQNLKNTFENINSTDSSGSADSSVTLQVIATSTASDSDTAEPQENKLSQPSVVIKGVTIPVDLAVTGAEHAKGLSGRASLPDEEGLLFIFAKAGVYQFWMPDMHFPIDILWIENDKIIDMDLNVSNEFDPVNPVYYRPSAPVQYVLEVNAGFSQKHNFKIGDSVQFASVK